MGKRTSWHRLLAFTFLSLLALDLGTRGDDWTEGGANATRTNASSEVTGSAFSAGSWSFPTYNASRVVSAPAVSDGFVVFGTAGGQVVALRAVDGTRLWQFSAQGGVVASPAIAKGRVFAPSLDGNLYGLRLSDGALLWTTPLGGAGYSSPTIAGENRLILGVGFPQKKVVLVDGASGNVVWQTAPGAISGLVNSSGAVSGNQALIGSMGGTYYALNLSSGLVNWTYDAAGMVNMSSPLIIGGTAYLLPGGSSSFLHAIDLGTGLAKAGWPLQITDPVAPPSGTVTRVNQAVSSPMQAGTTLIAQMRFDYSVQVDAAKGLYTYTLREYTIGIDPSVPSVKWMTPVGTLQTSNPNDIPELNMCPTPAGFQTATGPLVAGSSTIDGTLRVLDMASGASLWSGALSGPGRSSPAFANGRLFVGTDKGTLESVLSSTNLPPLPPTSGFSPSNGEVVTTLRPTLSWSPGVDPEGKPLSYAVRLSTSGEVLLGYGTEYPTAPGVTQVTLSADLSQGVIYTYAVRSRDPNGAWSEWSAPQSFAVNLSASPSITVNGTTYGTIGDALSAVVPGGTIQLGKGTLRLVQPLGLPAGVSLAGASAWETTLDARGLGSGVVLASGPGPGTTQVSGLLIYGASINIDAENQGSVIRNVVLEGAAQAGLQVEQGSSSSLVNATVVSNAVGARSLGALEVRNSIIGQNSMGLSASGGGSVSSSYNDLFGNPVAYDGTQAGTGDLAQSVDFSNAAALDYRLLKPQATTDAGNPADDYSQEPAPNGGRINMGAFGGTPLAETSQSAPLVASSSSSSSNRCAASVSSNPIGFPWILMAALAACLGLSFARRRPHSIRVGRLLPILGLVLFLLPAEGRPGRLRASPIWKGGDTTPPFNANSYQNPANWSPNGVPAAGDTVTFDGNTSSIDCTIDITVAQTTGGFQLINTYSGIVSRANGTDLTVGTGGFSQDAGTFHSAGSSIMSITGNFTLSNGTFDMEGGLNFSGATWNVTGGSLLPGSGVLTFNAIGAQTWQTVGAVVRTDQVWVEDAVPSGATQASDGGDSWNWVSSNPAPFSGKLASQSDNQLPPGSSNEHQHYFYAATAQISVGVGDTLFAYVFLNPLNPPAEVMLQWNDGSWEHRAYWGANKIGWGTDGTVSRHFMGGLPATNTWVKLVVNASDVGLEGSQVSGMAFTLAGGQATWDHAGRNGFGGQAAYGAVTIASGSTVTLPASYPAAIQNDLVVNGTFNSSGTNIAVQGNVTVGPAGRFTAGSTPVQIGGKLTVGDGTSAGSFDAGSSPLQIGNGVTLNKGSTLLAPSSNLMTVKGTFNADPAATFTHRSGRVMLLANGSYTFSPPSQPFNDLVVNDTLEGYWKLDETTAGSAVTDSSGYGRNGVPAGGSNPTPSTDVPLVNFTDARSLQFVAASSERVNLPTPPPLSNAQGVTLTGWIKPSSLGTQRIMSFATPAPANGLLGEYYDNTGTGSSPPPPKGSPMGGATTNNPKFARFDPNISFGFSSPPAPGIPDVNFMVAWTGKINITTADTYTFDVRTDDGSRVWVDGTLVIDSWVDQAPTDHTGSIALAAGAHNLRVEYYQNAGGSCCILSYQGADTLSATTGLKLMTVIPTTVLTPPPRNSRARLGITATGQVVLDGSSDDSEGKTLLSTGGQVAAGTWIHVAGVLDFANNAMTVYVKGLPVATSVPAFSQAITPPNACTQGALGSEANGLSNYFDGLMDDPRVFSRALKPQEIAALALGNQPTTGVASAASSETLFNGVGAVPLKVAGNFTLCSSSFDHSLSTIDLNGSWFNYGAAFSGDGGTVNLTGNAAGQTIQTGGQHFNYLNVGDGVTATTGAWTLADRLNVDVVLGIKSGTLDASPFTNVHAGAVAQTGGTFTRPATLVLMGTSLTLSDATTNFPTFTNLRVENTLDTNLVGYWKFDEGQGPVGGDASKATYDFSRRIANLHGGVAWTPSPAPTLFHNPYGLSFDGQSGSYADAGNGSALLGSQAAQSVSLWFNYPAATPTQDFISLTDVGAQKETNIGLFTSGTTMVGVRTTDLTGVSTPLIGATPPSTGTWHHLLYTFDGTPGNGGTSTNKLYLDGVLVNTAVAVPLAFSPVTAFFGCSSASGATAERYTGFLDDVRVYSGRALTPTEAASLNAGRYPAAGGGMVSSFLGGALTVSGTFDLDYGIFNANGFNATLGSAVGPVANVNSGSYQIDSVSQLATSTQTFNPGLTVQTSGVLETFSDFGVVSIPSSKVLDIKGTLRANLTGSTTSPGPGATIQSAGTFGFTVDPTATLDIDGLQIHNLNASGMTISDSPSSSVTYTKFNRLSFTNNPSATQYLNISRRAPLALVAPGCVFDASNGGPGKNINFTGTSGGSSMPTIIFEANAATGAGASSVSTAEGRTVDGDTGSPRNGVPTTPATNDGVVYWVTAAANNLPGTVVGNPTPAFRWSTFTWYATYLVFSDPVSGNDTIYVRGANGAPISTSNTGFAISRANFGSVVGAPLWDQETIGGQPTAVLYVATTNGPSGASILKFTGGTFTGVGGAYVDSPLTMVFSTVITGISQITSPPIMDATNLYFGGIETAATPQSRILAVSRASISAASASPAKDIAAASNVETAPSWHVNGGNTDLFLGSDVVTGVAHLYRVNISSGVVDEDNNTLTNSVVATTTFINNKLHVGDKGGFMHKADGVVSSATLAEDAGWPYHDAKSSTISGAAWVDPTSMHVFYGDWALNVYDLNPTATLVTGFPMTFTAAVAGEQFQTAPLFLPSNGKLAIGTNKGRLFLIQESPASLTFTYNFGPSSALSSISYSSAQNVYVVGTATGEMFYITPR